MTKIYDFGRSVFLSVRRLILVHRVHRLQKYFRSGSPRPVVPNLGSSEDDLEEPWALRSVAFRDNFPAQCSVFFGFGNPAADRIGFGSSLPKRLSTERVTRAHVRNRARFRWRTPMRPSKRCRFLSNYSLSDFMINLGLMELLFRRRNLRFPIGPLLSYNSICDGLRRGIEGRGKLNTIRRVPRELPRKHSQVPTQLFYFGDVGPCASAVGKCSMRCQNVYSEISFRRSGERRLRGRYSERRLS